MATIKHHDITNDNLRRKELYVGYFTHEVIKTIGYRSRNVSKDGLEGDCQSDLTGMTPNDIPLLFAPYTLHGSFRPRTGKAPITQFLNT